MMIDDDAMICDDVTMYVMMLYYDISWRYDDIIWYCVGDTVVET